MRFTSLGVFGFNPLTSNDATAKLFLKFFGPKRMLS
jgi:hypothetical protein